MLSTTHLETEAYGVAVPQWIQFQRLSQVVAARTLLLKLTAHTHSIAVKLELGGRRGKHTSTLMHARHVHKTHTHITHTHTDTKTHAQIRPELGALMYCPK